MIHPLADVQSKQIGNNTNVWQFCVVLPDAVIGENCNICAHVLIENDVQIGNNVTIKSGVQVWDGVRIEDNVFIGPNCAFYTPEHPLDAETRNKGLEYAYPIKVGSNVWFGGNVVVLGGVTIGDNTVIGAGSVVTKDIPSNVVAAGNPCKVIKQIEG